MLFLDSASLDDARQAACLPFFGGLSFNPTLLARALGTSFVTRDAFLRHLAALAEVTNGRRLYVQPVSHDTEGLLADAKDILKAVNPIRVVIKLPYSPDGLRAARTLVDRDIRTCVTSIFTPLQAYVAASIGADWIAPYCNRITRSGGDGVEAIRAMGQLIRAHGYKCQILAASVKSLAEMEAVLATGPCKVTVSLDLLEEAASHPMSEAAGAQFHEDLKWAGF